MASRLTGTTLILLLFVTACGVGRTGLQGGSGEPSAWPSGPDGADLSAGDAALFYEVQPGESAPEVLPEAKEEEVAPEPPDDGFSVSLIKFDDIHLAVGNPRKINPNTPELTEPDNVVRLSVEVLADQSEILDFQWTTDHGELIAGGGKYVHFVAHEEGPAHITCGFTHLVTGESGSREFSVNVQKAHQFEVRLKGDYAVWARISNMIEAVHLPSRKLITVGEGGLTSFDGKRITSKAIPHGAHAIDVFDLADLSTVISVSTPAMKQAWDHNFITIEGDRLYWGNANTQYTQYRLYTMDLSDQVEEFVFGPDLVLGSVPAGKRLVWGLKAPGSYNGYNNYMYNPKNDKVKALPQLDEHGLVRDWHDPWVVTQDYTGFRLVNLDSGEWFPVTSKFESVTSVVVSSGYYAGHARDPWGDLGSEIFLISFDGTFEERLQFTTNNFLNPSLDGPRVAWTENGDVFLYEAE